MSSTSMSDGCAASWRRVLRPRRSKPSGGRATACSTGADMAVRRSIFSRIVALAILLSLALVSGLWVLTDQTIRVTLEGSARTAVDVDQSGRASCRDRVWQYVYIWVAAVSLKKK